MSGAVIAAAIAVNAAAATARRNSQRLAERRRQEEEERRRAEKHRKEEERHRQDEKRRKMKEEQRRQEVERRRYEKDRNETIKRRKIEMPIDISEKYDFTEVLQIKRNELPAEVYSDGYEHKLADGSSYTKYKEDYAPTKIIHTLTNGVKRIYSQNFDELHLVNEEMPDGRCRGYKDGKLTYERDVEGNYKCYKSLNNEMVITEEGDINGKLRSYSYDNQYVTVTENTPQKEFVTCDFEGRIIKEGDNKTYKAYYADKSLKEEKDEQGTIRKWHENKQLASEKFADGHGCVWNEAGLKIREDYTHRSFASWYDNGQQRIDHKEDGSYVEWNEAGQKIKEQTTDKIIYKWYDDGTKKEMVKKDDSITRWHKETGTISYQKDSSGKYQSFDLLGRVIEEGEKSTKTTYGYYGDTNNKLYARTYTVSHYWNEENLTEESFIHYNKEGKEDTEKYLAIRKVAKERIASEDKMSQKVDNKRTITPKMSKMKKSIAVYKAMQKAKKQK